MLVHWCYIDVAAKKKSTHMTRGGSALSHAAAFVICVSVQLGSSEAILAQAILPQTYSV